MAVLQGLLLPPIFAVAVAYIGEEWPADEIVSVLGVYTGAVPSAESLGRFISGIAADQIGWRGAYLLLAGIALAGAIIAARNLPPERRFVASLGLAARSARCCATSRIRASS